MYSPNISLRSGGRARYFAAAGVVFLCLVALYTLSFPSRHYLSDHITSKPSSPITSNETETEQQQQQQPEPDVPTSLRPKPNLDDAVAKFRKQRAPCKGPRGKLMPESFDDQIHPTYFENITYPSLLSGSYDVLGLEKTWFTATERYGPYGFGEEKENYNRSRVDWNNTNWAELQNSCVEGNKDRLANAYAFDHGRPRFTYRETTWKERWLPAFLSTPKLKARPTSEHYGRSAIVVRAWSTFKYTPEDMWNLRSLVAETALATGGEYAVFILIDVKDRELNIHTSPETYDTVLREIVPPEFQDLAILFDTSMLESWYPKVGEHEPIMQIMQPLQLFSHFYPEFDHYWQIEVDSRFFGHTGETLDSFSDFARNDPRKQARERASWAYMPDFHGSYDDFFSKLNEVMEGGATVWGPINIHDLDIIGPSPPVKTPQEDNFSWGVGEEADLILLNTLEEASRDESWMFKNWHHGFSLGTKLPLFVSVVAQGRASFNLLNAIHHAQSYHGMRIPSEATLPSFALWHGLKISGIPLPSYQYPARDRAEMEFALNGGGLEAFKDGIAEGPSRYRGRIMGFFSNGLNWQWATSLPGELATPWYENEVEGQRDEERQEQGDEEQGEKEQGEEKQGEEQGEDEVKVLPDILLEQRGELYVPNIIIHPRKTNQQ